MRRRSSTLTAFYERVKHVQGRVGLEHVIATSIKEYLPAVLRVLFTLFKEKKEGHRITLAAGDLWMRRSAAARIGRAPGRLCHGRRPTIRAVILSSGGTTGTPKGVVGLHRHYVAAGHAAVRVDEVGEEPWVDVIMLPLPLFHVYANVGVQPMAFLGPNPLSLVPNPRDIDDLLKTIRHSQAGVFQRRADALHSDPQPSGGARRKDRPELDQVVLLGCRRPDG